MLNRFRHAFGLHLAVIASTVAVAQGSETAPTFEHDIRPLLKANCFHCHGEEPKLRGDLDLRLKRLIVAGGESGAAITPGDHKTSRLYELVSTGEMPPEDNHRLTAEEIALIARWIDTGALTAQAEPEGDLPAPGELIITDEEKNHWAYQPIKKAALPADGPTHPIDAFVARKLTEAKISPSPEADRLTLLRRATFDLLGLPPTKQQIDTFLADDKPGAWDRVIDRLLASPNYGERWGRHWLDVAGYADSEGYNDKDLVRTDAWAYRDYVIRSFNADKPWDQFITEQLAGDELAGVTAKDANSRATADTDVREKLTATGFLRMAPDGSGSSPDDLAIAKNQVMTETVKIVSSSLLGMTIACAECHHHRFDPIPQQDFYRMRAIFEPVYNPQEWRTPDKYNLRLMSAENYAIANHIEAEAKRVGELYQAERKEQIEWILAQELAKLPEDQRAFARESFETAEKERTPEHKKFLEDHPDIFIKPSAIHLYLQKYKGGPEKQAYATAISEAMVAIRSQKPTYDFIRAVSEVPEKLPVTKVFFRGDITSPEPEPVAPGGLYVLGGKTFPVDNADLATSGRRLAYAQHLTSGEHPLVARVLVNRFWMHHFGHGLVRTPGDFGARSSAPSHPQLLDWLAADFMENGWQLKRLHKLIMSSATYRQTSARRADADAIDADNTLLWRMPVRRLEAETIRDAMLAVSGELNPKAFGEPVPVKANPDGLFVVGGEGIAEPETHRRSVYVQTLRSKPVEMLNVFDAPQMEPNCEIRQASTVTTQALALMNGDFVLDQSYVFAKRVLDETGPDASSAEKIDYAWQLAFGDKPNDDERQASLAYLEKQRAVFDADKITEAAKDVRTLTSLCQVLYQANHFLYVD